MKLLLPVLLALTAMGFFGGRILATTAPQVLSWTYISCRSDGSIKAGFSWSPPDGQWLDVSLSPDFQGWSNARLTPGQDQRDWPGLRPNTTYYARVSTKVNGAWVRSNTLALTTLECQAPTSPDAATNLKAGGISCDRGRARVSFFWERHIFAQQWLDVSRDPNFSGWTNFLAGQGAIGFASIPLAPDTTYFARISTRSPSGGWLRSTLVTFHTKPCAPA
jgi:hypothetical protein